MPEPTGRPPGDLAIEPLAPEIVPDAAAVEAFWEAYRAAAGLPEGTPHGAFAFGSGPTMADQLLALVLSGAKRATAGLLAEYEAEGLDPFRDAVHEVVVDGRGLPACIIRYQDVRLCRFGDVDAAFAAREGEGDGSLAYWRDGHFRYFDPLLRDRFGRGMSDDEMLVLEPFVVVWPESAVVA